MTHPNDSTYPVVNPGFTYGDGSTEVPSVDGGMTKREALALGALQGILSVPSNYNSTVPDIAQAAVQYADALIEALNKEPETAK